MSSSHAAFVSSLLSQSHIHDACETMVHELDQACAERGVMRLDHLLLMSASWCRYQKEIFDDQRIMAASPVATGAYAQMIGRAEVWYSGLWDKQPHKPLTL